MALAHVQVRLRLVHADTRCVALVVSRDRNGLGVQAGLDTVSAVCRSVFRGGCLQTGAVGAVERRRISSDSVGAADGFRRRDGASTGRRAHRGVGLELGKGRQTLGGRCCLQDSGWLIPLLVEPAGVNLRDGR